MGKLSYEDRYWFQKYCRLFYLFAGFFLGMQIFLDHFVDTSTPGWVNELYPPSPPIALYIAGFFFIIAVALHIFFAWRYPRQFDSRSVFFWALYFTALNVVLFALPIILLPRTTLSVDTKAMVFGAAVVSLIVLPLIFWVARLLFFICHSPRKGSARTIRRGPSSLEVWEAECLSEKERTRMDDVLMHRLGELNEGLGQDAQEDPNRQWQPRDS